MERERVRYEVEQARHVRLEGGRVQPPPSQPQQEAEKVEAEDNSLEGWPLTSEWDSSHMQLAIEADIASTATATAHLPAPTAPPAPISRYLYCLCSDCRREPVLATARAGYCPNCGCPACHPTI